eukprot:3340595-Pyramimonas_sp.AAC.1
MRKRARSEGSQGSENPAEHLAGRLEDEPPDRPELPPGLPTPAEPTQAADDGASTPASGSTVPAEAASSSEE